MMCRTALAMALLMATVACGGDNPAGASGNPSNGSGGSGSGSNRGTVTAVVDGVAYTGSANAASLTNGTLNVASNNAALTVSVNFARTAAAVGTSTVGLASPLTLNVITTTGSAVNGSWTAAAGSGSGTLTIATLTATGASGTFTFTAVPVPGVGGAGATGNKVVTNGAFNVTF